MQVSDLDFHSIARDWYAILSPTAFTPSSYDVAIDNLALLAQGATRLLFGEEYERIEAEQIGAKLADLNFIQEGDIGSSLKALFNGWINNLPSTMWTTHQERLANLFADITNGYFKKAIKTILQNQETMQEGQLATVKTLHEDLQRQKDHLSLTAERLQTLLDIESGILTAQSAEAIADFALTHIFRIIPCDLAVFVVINPQCDSFVVLASKNTPEISGDSFPLSSTAEERLQALKSGEFLLNNDLRMLENRPQGLELLFSRGVKSVMNVPLLTANKLVGTLLLCSKTAGFFIDQHGEIAQQFADSIAVVLHNRQLLETEQNARRESETLREVAASLSSNLEQDELLDNILIQLENLLPHDGAIILLKKANKPQVVAQRGFEQKFVAMLNELEQLPPNMQRLMDTQKPVYIPDTNLDPEWIKLPGAYSVRCWLGAPLIFQGEIIGLLALDKNEPHFYQLSAVDLVLTFANHAAVAIKNAHLFKEVQLNSDILRERVAARTRELESLYEIAAISNQPVELTTILTAGLKRILDDLSCHSGSIHVLDMDSETFNLVEAINLDSSILKRFRSIEASNQLQSDLIDEQKPVILEHNSDDPQFIDWLLPQKAKCLVVGMCARGNLHGIMSLYCDQDQEITQDEIKLAKSIADHLGVAIDNANLQAQSEHAAVIEERERLARDLHDSATQSLFSLTLFAEAAREKMLSGQLDIALEYLDDIGYTANQTHRDMRLLLYQLGDSQLVEGSLTAALEHRLHAVEERSGINVIFQPNQTITLKPEVEQAIYQIANEALNNALKHAGGTSVTIELIDENSHVMLNVKDNGTGFDQTAVQKGAGMGLRNMQYRAYKLGGDLSIISLLGKGTEISVRIPKNGIE
ncbi:MAG: GAF domain-containing sensor histidine kinase [Candidatus Promineifilaceae bacterium]